MVKRKVVFIYQILKYWTTQMMLVGWMWLLGHQL